VDKLRGKVGWIERTGFTTLKEKVAERSVKEKVLKGVF